MRIEPGTMPRLIDKPLEVIVWPSGQGWAAALYQLADGRLSLAIAEDFDQLSRLASQNPYAVSVWEVNLTNWEDRARRLSEFLRSRPSGGVCIALDGLPESARDLFQELGAPMILCDRLSGVDLLRWVRRSVDSAPAESTFWPHQQVAQG